MAIEVTNSNEPAGRIFNITPNDSVDTKYHTRGILLGSGDGTLSIISTEGDTVNMTGLQTGVVYPFRATRVRSSNTGAGNIVGLA